MNENVCCIGNILEVINILQNKAEKIDDIPNTCDRPFLGFCSVGNQCVYNTRPISLYTANNTEITMPYEITFNGETITGESTVFRIEKIDNCCATFRVLAPNPDTTSDLPYVRTDSFFNMNLCCVCALRCLADTFIDCV